MLEGSQRRSTQHLPPRWPSTFVPHPRLSSRFKSMPSPHINPLQASMRTSRAPLACRSASTSKTSCCVDAARRCYRRRVVKRISCLTFRKDCVGLASRGDHTLLSQNKDWALARSERNRRIEERRVRQESNHGGQSCAGTRRERFALLHNHEER